MNWKLVHSGRGEITESALEKQEEQGANLLVNYQ
jgi:hypothetical protein